jgi:hypothetical protein
MYMHCLSILRERNATSERLLSVDNADGWTKIHVSVLNSVSFMRDCLTSCAVKEKV